MQATLAERNLGTGPGATFRLNDCLEISDFHGGNYFAGRKLGSDQAQYRSLLDLKCPDVAAAIRSAFDGVPSMARYVLRGDAGESHCELHCFPSADGRSRELTCFLLDRTEAENAAAGLKRKIYILDIINQVIKAFAETRNLSEVLRIILLGVTAGPGLGFNRAFILLSNESRTHLWGCLATGPSTPEEAGAIWQSLALRGMTLEDILGLYKSAPDSLADSHVNRLVASLKIPLGDDLNFITRAVSRGHSLISARDDVEMPGNRELFEKLKCESIAVVPLISRDNLQGVLLADNLITGRPILQSDLNVLEIFARYAADAIENSRLYGRLEQQVCRLKDANEQIIRSRENLIKAEKLSSVAKMALEVAHEIRNPLTVIGGYAISQSKRLEPGDRSYRVLEIISRQVSRIEEALDRFSSVVTLSEKMEGDFPLAHLLKETLCMLSGGANSELPLLQAGENEREIQVFIDPGLFHQAMIAILRKASQISGGFQNLILRVASNGPAARIFLSGTDNCANFAENFYRLFRESKGDLSNQDMAVALEILQHYGGGVGVMSDGGSGLRVYIELPLHGEER